MPIPAPFVFGRTADLDNFVDRDPERARLIANFTARTNTIIISPRRWGKSSLVERAAVEAQDGMAGLTVCLIDVFGARTEQEFYAQLAKGVIKATSTRLDEWTEAARQFLAHLRPKISFTPDLTQEVTLDFDWEVVRREPDEILDLAENIATAKGLTLVVCIDEFQSVADFPDSLAFQRKLRSHWQRHQHVSYCLYGSKRHMLTHLFADPSMPFYRFGDIMMLPKIDNEIWGEFIQRRFADTGKTISLDDARHIAAIVDNHSYYVQQLAQQVWFRADPTATTAMVDDGLATLRDQLSLVFTGLASTLSTRQIRLLHAILDDVTELSAQDTLKRYGLGTSANVTRMKVTLENREFIDIANGHIDTLDPLFAYWLRTDYFARG